MDSDSIFQAIRDIVRLHIGYVVHKRGRLFGPKRDEIAGEWRRLHNKELCDLYSSSIIILVIKSRRLKSEMGRTCGAYGWEERCIQGFSGET